MDIIVSAFGKKIDYRKGYDDENGACVWMAYFSGNLFQKQYFIADDT